MTQDNIERRLAAILIADVAGYSRLMGQDEAGTLRALQSHRFAVVDPTIGQYRGRIVKRMGDGILVEFKSVVDAVECAIAIQNGIVGRNADVPEDKQLKFRIGINLGDVLIEGDDIYGDGINVAARLEQLAEPNGVCISQPVFTHIEGEIDQPFSDLGAHQVKNIAKPVRAYHYSPVAGETAPRAAYRPFIDDPPQSGTKITGGCLCGAVRYEFDQPELGTMYCHCRMCQRFTGAPVIAGTTFLTESMRYTRGEPKYYRSSKIAERGFCGDCGSGLVYRGLIGKWNSWILVFTASLDKPEHCVPTYHLGVESAMPWHEVLDGLPRTRCDDSPSLVEAYALVDQEIP